VKPFWLFFALLFFAAPLCFGGVADINASKLPADRRARRVLQDALELEPSVAIWQDIWRSNIPRKDAVKRLEKDIAELQSLRKETPSNLELQLLTMLVGHFAYNVDIPRSWELVRDAFEESQKTDPKDPRTRWFWAIHQCQTSENAEAMRVFLQLENSNASLPSAFWDDYLFCASGTNMPAHALRAAEMHLKDAPHSELRSSLVNINRSRFTVADSSVTYKPEDVWAALKGDDQITLSSTMCGLAFTANAQWHTTFPDAPNGCFALMEAGPHKTDTGEIIPNILVFVRPAKDGEDLAQFAKTLLKTAKTLEHVEPLFCPAKTCFSVHGVTPALYKAGGDGHAFAVAFESKEPPFPGLEFEEPTGLPKPSNTASGPQYYRPKQRMKRLPGTLYYLVLLDTATSILDVAKTDYVSVLKSIKVE
jgi:hypothetical protein